MDCPPVIIVRCPVFNGSRNAVLSFEDNVVQYAAHNAFLLAGLLVLLKHCLFFAVVSRHGVEATRSMALLSGGCDRVINWTDLRMSKKLGTLISPTTSSC